MGVKIGEILVRAGAVASGAAVGAFSDKLMPGVGSPVIRNLLKIGVGAALPAFMPKQKFLGHAGDGLLAQGVSGMVTQMTGGVGGIDDRYLGSIDEDFMGELEAEEVSGLDDEYSV